MRGKTDEFNIGDLVVPLFEKEFTVVKVSGVGKALEVEIDGGWQISAKCNYRKATKEEALKYYGK